jgi:hypothetical protein
VETKKADALVAGPITSLQQAKNIESCHKEFARRYTFTMKTTAVIAAGLVASAQGFTPSPQGRVTGTQLSESLFDKVFGMDLFNPVKDQNDYGARVKKNVSRSTDDQRSSEATSHVIVPFFASISIQLKVGEIKEGKSYVPAGLSAAQYNKVRAEEAAKKKARYEKNVKKAGVFEDYTEFYLKRGTDTTQNWKKSATNGHRMAKTKYDWSGNADKPLWAKKG